MKKRIFTLLISAVMALSTAGCGKEAASNNDADNSDKIAVNSNADSSDNSNASDATDSDIENTESTEEGDDFDDALAKAEVCGERDGASYDNWKDAYKNTIETFVNDNPDYDCTFALVYVNEDDTPEILINPNTMDDIPGIYLITYTEADGTVNTSTTNSLMFSYIPKSNVINSTRMDSGVEYDSLISIRDGKWVQLGYGTQQYTDAFTWNGKSLENEDAYAETILKYYNYGTAEAVEDYVSKEEVLANISAL